MKRKETPPNLIVTGWKWMLHTQFYKYTTIVTTTASYFDNNSYMIF